MKVLITGAAGAIGSTLREGLAGRYDLLRLSDRKDLGHARAGEELARADLGDFDAVMAAMQGIDCVVHLGGIPREAAWPDLLQANIAGSFHVFEAARLSGTRRVIFASSNHALGFHRATQELDADSPMRPDSRYGVTKVFGEALGRLYADKHGLGVACLRIGSFRPQPEDARQLATWISPRDMTELVRCCIEAPEYRFLVLYGVSANTRSRWRNRDAVRVGYQPRDNAEAWGGRIDCDSARGTAAEFHGGSFCELELSNHTGNID